jgi:hypothetical protein
MVFEGVDEQHETFTSLDGLALRGTLTRSENVAGRGVVLVHGGGVTRDEGGFFTRLAAGLAAAGALVLRFDFRGHGESAGRQEDLTLAAVRNDIRAAVALALRPGVPTAADNRLPPAPHRGLDRSEPVGGLRGHPRPQDHGNRRHRTHRAGTPDPTAPGRSGLWLLPSRWQPAQQPARQPAMAGSGRILAMTAAR